MTSIVISYVPLLSPDKLSEAWRKVRLINPNSTKEEIKQLVEEINTAIQSGPDNEAQACLWVAAKGRKYDPQGDLTPILAYPDDVAHRLGDHLKEWAEGKPQNWFHIEWGSQDQSYGVALMPDVKKTADRMKLRTLMETGQELPGSKDSEGGVHVYFRPLQIFVKSSHMAGIIREKHPKKSYLGLARVSDIKNLEPGHPPDSHKLTWLGPFEWRTSEYVQDWILAHKDAPEK